MVNSIKKRGQKIYKRVLRVSKKASDEGKEHIRENFISRLSHVLNIKLLIFEWVLLISALIMLAITQAFWFGNSYGENTFVAGGTYTEGTIGKVTSLNPLFATTSSEKTLSRLLFATLTTIDYSGHPKMELAQSITPSENGKIWTLTLKDNLKWSDGEPITIEDVMFTIELIQHPAINSIYASNLAKVKASLNDNGQVVFELAAPYADFVSVLNIPVLPEHALSDVNPQNIIEHNFSINPITSGPFMLNTIQNSSSDQIVYLSANPHYYKGRALLNNFAVHTYTDKASIINALNTEVITATAELAAADKPQITANSIYEKDSSINFGVFAIINTNKIKDKNLRAAIRQGIDMAAVREKAPNTTALDYPLIENQVKLTNYPKIADHDVEAAKAKIAELTDENFKINVVTTNSGFFPEVGAAFVEQLANLGINAELTINEDNQDFITNTITKRAYDILIYEIELGPNPDLLTYYHSSQTSSSGLNLSNYVNSLVDDLLLAARETTNEALRVKKYESFLEHWVEDVPSIGLYQSNLAYFYNKNARTFSDDVRLVAPLDRFTDVTNWAVNKASKNRTP